MKTIFKVLVGAAVATLLASCSHKQDFYTDSYARLGGTSYEIPEDAGICRIPVNSYNCSGKTGTVTFVVTDGTAVQGVDYNIEPASGVINIDGNGTAFIDVLPIAHLGELTGDLEFSITLTGSTGIDLGASAVADVKIKDTDHPLTDMFGTYYMSAITYDRDIPGLKRYAWNFIMSPYDGDVTRVWLSNICVMTARWYAGYTGACPVYAVVSDDHKTITIPLPQETTGSLSAWGLSGHAWAYAHEGTTGGYIDSNSQVVFTWDETNKVYITSDSFGISHPDDIVDYNLFYEGAVNYSDAGTTYFYKTE